jgi:uncharacterized protein YijF (DUF1287 family)
MRARALLLLLPIVAAAARADAPIAARIADAARRQVGVTIDYDPAYVQLRYPGGDVPRDRGVCSDVVVRAFRAAGIDLQVAVHEDMAAHFRVYPHIWGLAAPDKNIDHRRVPNLMTFFTRRGKSLGAAAPYEPGDVVAWRLPSGLYHLVVADARRPRLPGGAQHRLRRARRGRAARVDHHRALPVVGRR